MEKAHVRLRAAEVVSLVTHEREMLASGRITVDLEQRWPLVQELLRLGLVELVKDAGEDKLIRHGSQVELERAADNLVQRANVRYRRAKDVALGREVAAMPAIAAAENDVAAAWLRSQVERLRALHTEFETSVEKHADLLPGLVDMHGQRSARWHGSSVSTLLLTIVNAVVEATDSDGWSSRHDLDAVDWEDLGVKLECELAELGRRLVSSPASHGPTTTIEFVFQRILVQAAGEKLGFAQIFERAKSNPKTSDLFPMSVLNTDHEKRIRGLVGGQTVDGWLIRGSEGGRGRRREFWAERVTAPEPI